MPEVVPIKNLANATTLYDNNGECVGRWVPETGRGIIGDCLVVKERTCTVEQDYDADDEDCRIWQCFSCDSKFPLFRGCIPRFCPNCGAKVV